MSRLTSEPLAKSNGVAAYHHVRDEQCSRKLPSVAPGSQYVCTKCHGMTTHHSAKRSRQRLDAPDTPVKRLSSCLEGDMASCHVPAARTADTR